MAKKNVAVIFGAGATKDCGGPLTADILPDALKLRDHLEREGFIALLDRFLVENFHLDPQVELRERDDYPGLPLLLSLVDMAIDRKHSLGPAWTSDQLRNVRDALEYTIFALLEHRLKTLQANPYLGLLRMLCREPETDLTLISLNYDLIADNSLIAATEVSRNEAVLTGAAGTQDPAAPVFPEYACDIATEFYRSADKTHRLLKLHGSLNWLYCPGCHRLDVGISEGGRDMTKVLDKLYHEAPGHRLEHRYGCHGSPCADCETHVRPVLITPSQSKDYRNPHIAQVWYSAERALRTAERVIIVGYSLPDDDVPVAYLLKRGLVKARGNDITVVEFDRDHRDISRNPVGMRYRTLFGDKVDWRTEGFSAWVNAHGEKGLSPVHDRLPRVAASASS